MNPFDPVQIANRALQKLIGNFAPSYKIDTNVAPSQEAFYKIAPPQVPQEPPVYKIAPYPQPDTAPSPSLQPLQLLMGTPDVPLPEYPESDTGFPHAAPRPSPVGPDVPLPEHPESDTGFERPPWPGDKLMSPEIRDDERALLKLSSPEIRNDERALLKLLSPEIRDDERALLKLLSPEIRDDERALLKLSSPEIRDDERVLRKLLSPEIRDDEKLPSKPSVSKPRSSARAAAKQQAKPATTPAPVVRSSDPFMGIPTPRKLPGQQNVSPSTPRSRSTDPYELILSQLAGELPPVDLRTSESEVYTEGRRRYQQLLAQAAPDLAEAKYAGTTYLGTPAPMPGMIESFMRGLGTGAGSVVDITGALMQALGAEETGQSTRDLGQRFVRFALQNVPDEVVDRWFSGLSALGTPSGAAFFFGQIAPSLLPVGGAAGLTARAGGALAGARGAATGAMLGGGAAEAVLNAGDAAAQARDTLAADFAARTPEELVQVPAIAELVAKGVPLEQAKKQTIDEAGKLAALLAAPAGAAAGAVTGPIFAAFFTRLGPQVTKKLAARVLGAAGKAATAEGISEGAVGLASEIGIGRAGLEKDYGSVAEQAALGAIGGGVLGALAGAVSRPSQPTPRPSQPTQATPPVQSTPPSAPPTQPAAPVQLTLPFANLPLQGPPPPPTPPPSSASSAASAGAQLNLPFGNLPPQSAPPSPATQPFQLNLPFNGPAPQPAPAQPVQLGLPFGNLPNQGPPPPQPFQFRLPLGNLPTQPPPPRSPVPGATGAPSGQSGMLFANLPTQVAPGSPQFQLELPFSSGLRPSPATAPGVEPEQLELPFREPLTGPAALAGAYQLELPLGELPVQTPPPPPTVQLGLPLNRLSGEAPQATQLELPLPSQPVQLGLPFESLPRVPVPSSMASLVQIPQPPRPSAPRKAKKPSPPPSSAPAQPEPTEGAEAPASAQSEPGKKPTPKAKKAASAQPEPGKKPTPKAKKAEASAQPEPTKKPVPKAKKAEASAQPEPAKEAEAPAPAQPEPAKEAEAPAPAQPEPAKEAEAPAPAQPEPAKKPVPKAKKVEASAQLEKPEPPASAQLEKTEAPIAPREKQVDTTEAAKAPLSPAKKSIADITHKQQEPAQESEEYSKLVIETIPFPETNGDVINAIVKDKSDPRRYKFNEVSSNVLHQTPYVKQLTEYLSDQNIAVIFTDGYSGIIWHSGSKVLSVPIDKNYPQSLLDDAIKLGMTTALLEELINVGQGAPPALATRLSQDQKDTLKKLVADFRAYVESNHRELNNISLDSIIYSIYTKGTPYNKETTDRFLKFSKDILTVLFQEQSTAAEIAQLTNQDYIEDILFKLYTERATKYDLGEPIGPSAPDATNVFVAEINRGRNLLKTMRKLLQKNNEIDFTELVEKVYAEDTSENAQLLTRLAEAFNAMREEFKHTAPLVTLELGPLPINHLGMATTLLKSVQIRLSKNIPPEHAERVLLHEAAHAFMRTADLLHESYKNENGFYAKSFKEINETVETARTLLANAYKQKFPEKELPPSLESTYEFFAELFASPALRKAMDAVLLEKDSTIWSRFKTKLMSIAAHLLRIEPKSPAIKLLDDIFNAVGSLRYTKPINDAAMKTWAAGGGNVSDAFRVSEFLADMFYKHHKAAPYAASVRDTASKWETAVSKTALSVMHVWNIIDRYAPLLDKYYKNKADNPLRLYQEVNKLKSTTGNRWLNRLSVKGDEWAELTIADPKMAERMNRLMLDATMWAVHPNLPFNEPENAHLHQRVGGHAQWKRLNNEWNQLPAKYKKFYSTIENELKDVWNEIAYLVLSKRLATMGLSNIQLNPKNPIDSFWVFMNNPHTPKATAVELKKIYDQFPQFFERKGPYFPLRRMGDYYVLATTSNMRDNMTDAELAQLRLDPHATLIAENRRSDGTYDVTWKYRLVSSYETRAAAKAAVEQIKRDNPNKFDEITYHAAKEALLTGKIVPAGLLDAIKDYVPAHSPDAAAALARFLIEVSPETSIRKLMARRVSIAGATPDMLRAYAQYARGAAYSIAQLRYGGRVIALINAIHSAGKSIAPSSPEENELAVDLEEVANSLTRRERTLIESTFTYSREGLSTGRLSFMTFVSMLGTPAFWLTNAMQPILTTIPMVGARFGTAATIKALTRAYRDIADPAKQHLLEEAGRVVRRLPPKAKTVSVVEHLMSNLSVEEQQLLRNIADRGHIDITMAIEIDRLAQFGATPKNIFHLGADWLIAAPHFAEIVNRVTTALAAYRLFKANSRIADPIELINQATDYAAETVVKTQVDYSAAGRPELLLRPHLKSILMFKNYGLHMYQVFWNYLEAAFGRNPSIPRKESLKALGLMVLVHGLAGGVIGATWEPVWLLAELAAHAAGTDAETWLRESLANFAPSAMIDAIAGGAPAAVGVDLSRVGLHSMLIDSYFSGADPSDPHGFAQQMILNALGAPASAVRSWLQGIATVATTGDVMKGMAIGAPVAMVRDAIKTYQLATEGLLDSRGNVILPSEELPAGAAALRALGFTHIGVRNVRNRRAAAVAWAADVQRARSDIFQTFTNGILRNDPDLIADARAKLIEFNATYADTPITLEALRRAVYQRARAAQDLQELGVAAPIAKRRATELVKAYPTRGQ